MATHIVLLLQGQFCSEARSSTPARCVKPVIHRNYRKVAVEWFQALRSSFKSSRDLPFNTLEVIEAYPELRLSTLPL